MAFSADKHEDEARRRCHPGIAVTFNAWFVDVCFSWLKIADSHEDAARGWSHPRDCRDCVKLGFLFKAL